MLFRTCLHQLYCSCAGLAVERPSLPLAVYATVVRLGTLPALAPLANQFAGATLGRMAPQEAPQLLRNLQPCSLPLRPQAK